MAQDIIREITIYEVETLQTQFLQMLNDAKESQKSINLDLSELVKIDMVGIQLLISFAKSAKKDDVELVLNNVTTLILKEIKAVNCEAYLGLQDG